MALIIAGHQRSGTTLLKNLFNSHPEISITGEFGNFMLIDAPYSVYARFILHRWWRKRNAAILQSYPLKGMNMWNNLVFVLMYLKSIKRHAQGWVQVRSIENALKDCFPNSRIVGDKYPDHVFELQKLVRGEGIKCLFISRDPRDVASSALKRGRTELRNSWPDELRSARLIAERWCYAMKLIEQYRDKIFLVRYEDLVLNPRLYLSKFGDWIGVNPEGFRNEIVHAKSIGKYLHGLTEDEISEIIEVAGPVMQRFDYTY